MSPFKQVMELPALKIRSWALESGEILVLLFVRKDGRSDKLELLSEQYAKDEEEVNKIISEAGVHLENAMKEAGLHGGRALAKFHGSKDA